jgi:segregation and condensation protein B
VEREQQRRIVEALILASPEPIAAARIAALLPRCNPSQVRGLVKELNEEYVEQRRAFEIWEVAGGYQLRSLPEFAPYLKQIQNTRPLRLSPAALETVAIVAYRQPVTRSEVEHIRGVDVGAVLRSLLERQLIRIAGHREVPGRPIIYATTRRFLEVFGLTKLGDLPTLRDLAELAPGVTIDGEPDESEVADEEGVASPELSEASTAPEVDAESAPAESIAPEAKRESAPATATPPPPSATH